MRLVHIREPSICQICQTYQKRSNRLILRFFEKNIHMPHVVFGGRRKTGLGFEIGQQQQKQCWRKPKLQSLANPVLYKCKTFRGSRGNFQNTKCLLNHKNGTIWSNKDKNSIKTLHFLHSGGGSNSCYIGN